MTIAKRVGLLVAAGMIMGLSAQATQAQTAKPIRFIVGFPPGGAVDLIARAVAPGIGEVLGTTVVVDNRAGASGGIGAELLAIIRFTAGAAVCALALSTTGAAAQDFGTKPVRIVVGFAPGGSNDLVARALAPRITAGGGTQAIVDNRPGANGMIAAEHVARSPADGHTVILTGVSTFVLNPLVYPKVSYDTLRDFGPITIVASMPQIIVAHPSLPAKGLKDIVEIARRAPGTLSAAHPGVGGLSHLTLEMLKGLANLQITDVAYKGTGPGLTDVVGGHVPLLVSDLPAPLPLVKAGKLRALAVTGEARTPLLPDVRTAREQGYAGLQATNWLGVMAPARTPPAVIDSLHAAFTAATAAPETREIYAKVGVSATASRSPAAFAEFVRGELARWEKVVRQANVKLK